MKIEGLEEAFDYLDQQIAEIESVSQAGLWEAGLGIMRSAQHRLRPSVISGNLRASGYVRNNKDLIQPEPDDFDQDKSEPVPTDELPAVGVELGFTANYALYAHENMEGRAPKFLEYAVSENKQAVVEIIRKRSGGK